MYKISFADFWPNFNYHNFIIYKILKEHIGTEVEVIPYTEKPDLLICSLFKQSQNEKFSTLWEITGKPKTLFVSGENRFPDLNLYDYSISCHDFDFGHRNFMLPYYMLEDNLNFRNMMELRESSKKYLKEKEIDPFQRRYTGALVSNDFCADPERRQLLEYLICKTYLQSSGMTCNTTGKTIPKTSTNTEFFRDYSFGAAFENSKVDDYVTEKIVNVFAAYSIPIYYGTDTVSGYFPQEYFINASECENNEDLIKELDYLRKNKMEYMRVLDGFDLWYERTGLPEYKKIMDRLGNFLDHVVTGHTYNHEFGNTGMYFKTM